MLKLVSNTGLWLQRLPPPHPDHPHESPLTFQTETQKYLQLKLHCCYYRDSEVQIKQGLSGTGMKFQRGYQFRCEQYPTLHLEVEVQVLENRSVTDEAR